MKINLKPKFAIGQTVYKVCSFCHECNKCNVGCAIECKEQYRQIALKTKVDGYRVVKKNGKYHITYHIEKGSHYTDSYESADDLFKNKQDAENYALNHIEWW